MKKILIATGGGDCPGLNAVIRGITRAALNKGGYEVWGSMEAFNGIMEDPVRLMPLDKATTAGIHVKGGTIIQTTNKGNPLDYPVRQPDGSIKTINRIPELAERIHDHGFTAVVNIGGDGSQKISQALFEAGVPILGVPKTIDNDLSATDRTFGFSTAVQIASDCFDKLVTTAESHHRVIIMEVMGRDAGWIALHTAIAGGAEICLIPEIPYRIDKIVDVLRGRYKRGRGFANIVISEGAKVFGGDVVGKYDGGGDAHIKYGGVANLLRHQIEETGFPGQVRSTILGHIQRGGTPIAYDRILGTTMGVKAFEMIEAGQFGNMVSFKNNALEAVTLQDAIKEYNYVNPDHYLVKAARSMGVSFGD